jgi:hypothetical protein
VLPLRQMVAVAGQEFGHVGNEGLNHGIDLRRR